METVNRANCRCGLASGAWDLEGVVHNVYYPGCVINGALTDDWELDNDFPLLSL